MCLKCITGLTDCDPKTVKIETARHGKPICTSHNVFFSISHSGDFVICAAEKYEVGADIEKIRPVSTALIRKVCTESEAEWAADCAEKFFEIWTAKEAYLKLTGMGISGGLKTAKVNPIVKNVNGHPYETKALDGYIYTVVREKA